MAFSMRALYYIFLHAPREGEDAQEHEQTLKANENCLNQNFTILAQKIYELEERLNLLEGNS